MPVLVHVPMLVHTYECVCVHAPVWVYACMLPVNVCVPTCMCVHMHASLCVYLSLWVDMPGRGGECLCVGVNVCVGVCMPLCVHTCVFRGNCPWETLCVCQLLPSLMQLQGCTLSLKSAERWT